MTEQQIAVVVGAGPGLGNALVDRFARSGMTVAALSRSGGHVASTPEPDRERVRGYACDATQSAQVTATFAKIETELGIPDLVVFNVGTWDRGSILDLSEELFCDAWRNGCLAGFLVGQAAARMMAPHDKGTIVFTGATASRRVRLCGLCGSEVRIARVGSKHGTRTRAQGRACRARDCRRHDRSRAGRRFTVRTRSVCDRRRLLRPLPARPKRMDARARCATDE